MCLKFCGPLTLVLVVIMNIEHLYRNSPSHPKWEGSFVERLHEYSEWDEQAFWLVHKDLVELAKEFATVETVPKDIAARVVALQKTVSTSFAANFNKNDGFVIDNLDTEKLHEFMERFDMAVLGVFTGQVLPESSFDLVSPLLVNN